MEGERICGDGLGGFGGSYLVRQKPVVLPRVLVDEVERVARELHAAGGLALAEEGALAAYVIPSVLRL